MSLGSPDTPGVDPMEAAVARLSDKALFVAAAGNGGEAPGTIWTPGSAPTALWPRTGPRSSSPPSSSDPPPTVRSTAPNAKARTMSRAMRRRTADDRTGVPGCGDRDRPPVRMSLPQAFSFGGAVAAGAVLVALYERE